MKNGPYELVIAPKEYPGKKYRGRYCYEHHLVMWEHTGKLPKKGEVVHHKNHKKRDNRIGNLEIKKDGKHKAQHNKEKGRLVVLLECPSCGESFEREKRNYLAKRKKLQFCTRPCIGAFNFTKASKTKKKESRTKVLDEYRVISG